MNMYTQAVFDMDILNAFGAREHFEKKSKEEIREEVKEEIREEVKMEEKTETVLNMLSADFTVKQIALATKLTEKEIYGIAKNASVH